MRPIQRLPPHVSANQAFKSQAMKAPNPDLPTPDLPTPPPKATELRFALGTRPQIGACTWQKSPAAFRQHARRNAGRTNAELCSGALMRQRSRPRQNRRNFVISAATLLKSGLYDSLMRQDSHQPATAHRFTRAGWNARPANGLARIDRGKVRRSAVARRGGWGGFSSPRPRSNRADPQTRYR